MTQYKALNFLGYPGYRVGDDGSVWSRWKDRGPRGRVMADVWKRKKLSYSCRRLVTRLSNEDGNKVFAVHRLVLLSFVGPCPDGMEACHWDGDCRNNKLSNLRWDTHVENELDKERHGTRKKGARVHFAKLTEDEVRAIRTLYAERAYSMSNLAVRFGVTIGTIHPIIHRRTWKEI